ncbi:MAG: Tungsten-containing formylmethanofuran dehydrogenase 2 subunit C [Methanoregula sp. PtaU1.Bin051]|nr:MAG: Tungsten-containing formylmethanofuran dehydrogenase 2 subunit C [Methanoregula sp. PtaU1.Bin051]
MKPYRIDARDIHYTPLNQMIRRAVNEGVTDITIDNVLGQRFIADGLRGEKVTITINGVPGGDLGMFMSGPTVIVNGNADHAPGNTMDAGMIVIHGSAGDAVAHSMRGGRVYVRDNIGYRGGIHMKQYLEKRPILVVGGSARAFLGEYMAGGLLIVLGMHGSPPLSERGIGSGIHGGEIFVRGKVDNNLLGVGAKQKPATDDEKHRIGPAIRDFAEQFSLDPTPLLASDYTRIVPASARPFANKYTWE